MVRPKILIAGANGIIGSYLRRGYSQQYDFTLFGYDHPKKTENILNVDLTDQSQTRKFIKDQAPFNVLIFLVGLAHKKSKYPELYKKLNYDTLVNILTSCEEYDKFPEKIIFASTVSVYGEKYTQNIYNESLSPKPFSSYALTKLMSEKFLKNKYSDKSWILRFAPGYSDEFLLNINRRTKISNRYYQIGDGSKKLSLCNINNIISAVDGIFVNKVPAGTYNLSDSNSYTYAELLNWQKAKTVIGIPRFLVRIIYFAGIISGSTFIRENTIKLLTDNVFPSDKIRAYINLSSTISNVRPNSD